MNNQTIEELNKRNLDECLFCIYSIPVTIYFNSGDNVINPKTLLIFYGCNLQGKRRYISSIISDDLEKTSDWYNFFLTFKDRNLKTILYGLLPNNSSIQKAAKLAFSDIEVFDSYCDSLLKITKYLTTKYSSSTLEFVKRIYVSRTIDEYTLNYDEFKERFANSQFLIDLLNPYFIKAKDNYNHPFELRKHIFAFYFIREFSKKITVVSHSKPYFNSVDDFISSCITIIQLTEKKIYCPKNDWISLINLIYSDKKDLINCYL